MLFGGQWVARWTHAQKGLGSNRSRDAVRYTNNLFENNIQQQHPFNGPLFGTTLVSWHQKGKTNVNFTEARDSEWQLHHLGHIQVCTSLQTDNHASTPPLRCPSCCQNNSVKALTSEINTQGEVTSQKLWP